MPDSNTPRFQWNRWYDICPNLRGIVKLTENMPMPVKEKVAADLLRISRSFYDRLGEQVDLEKLDALTLDNLYKSHRKQRWYDYVPDMLEAMNLIMLLPKAKKLQLDKEISVVLGYVTTQWDRYHTPIPKKGTVTLPGRTKG